MVKILFVCHGNICRSPMAEFVMKQIIRDEHERLETSGLHVTDFEIASAATSTEEIGNPVYPPAKRMLASHSIDCNGKTARQMTVRDYEYYDYIVLMDKNNLRNLRWILPASILEREGLGRDPRNQRKISLLMDYTSHPRDVADPWYTGDFTATWNDVNEGCRGLLNEILASKLQ
ncbi:MAG: low molecular weight phosphotyrosine protein phosphatase [Fibrobacter sp.]|nr:low molecular weight phosphotyrosine protein phosphatase [Fibrobacter sp.]